MSEFLNEVAVVVSPEQRGGDYGTPAQNHGCTAALWSTYLSRKFEIEVTVDARDVCLLNALQKISRDANRPKRDNLIDLAGYAENASRCERDHE